MGFQQGLSGLNAASKSLEAIGNNVSNAATVGFKQSQVQFADVYASSLSGSGASPIGIGTKMVRSQQQFTQGNVTSSNNPLDMAINGNGFFRMRDSRGDVTFTRNGQFQLNKDGYIENATGGRLTGFPADLNGRVNQGVDPEPIAISNRDLPPKASTSYDVVLNLDSRVDALPSAGFRYDDPLSYHNATSVPVYDSLGNSHTLQTFYMKTGPGVWDVYATLDGDPVRPPAVAGDPEIPIARLEFASNGELSRQYDPLIVPPALPATPAPPEITLTMTNGADDIVLDVGYKNGTTQFGSLFAVNSQQQDGFMSGTLTGFSLSPDGKIVGRYTNGQANTLAQVALTKFANPNGLQAVGNNAWVRTAMAGEENTNAPGSGGLGAVQSSAVEDSNVDLTAELVNMITAQRIYQANAQTIKTEDQIMQTLVNLR
jgi:flagellar hook protein FlgE